MMTIAEFCSRHSACSEGREWALANCRNMDHAWETLKPDWLIWVATRPGVLDDRTLRLFAVWSARQVQHLMADQRSIAAIDVSERYANGQATDQELAAARAAARAAAQDAASAARAAAWNAAREAARDAASAAALDAALDAASAAAGAAERDAAKASQAEWLRANAKPCFDGGAR